MEAGDCLGFRIGPELLGCSINRARGMSYIHIAASTSTLAPERHNPEVKQMFGDVNEKFRRSERDVWECQGDDEPILPSPTNVSRGTGVCARRRRCSAAQTLNPKLDLAKLV